MEDPIIVPLRYANIKMKVQKISMNEDDILARGRIGSLTIEVEIPLSQWPWRDDEPAEDAVIELV